MSNEPARVVALSVAPVKGLRIARRERVRLERDGIPGDRRFYLLDDRGRMVNGKHSGALHEITAELDDAKDVLTLAFPSGHRVSAPVIAGRELQASYRSDPRPVREVEGPWAAAVSEHVGEELRLVVPADGSPVVDRGELGAVTVMAIESLRSLAAVAGTEIDPRRFRMSIEIDGAGAFAEDGWLGREIHIGEATIRPRGHVGRCIVTSRDPETGVVDVPTLDLLRDLRGAAATTEPLALGVWGEVLVPGEVRVGDAVRLDRSD
jgi:MOSC domain-containing protein